MMEKMVNAIRNPRVNMRELETGCTQTGYTPTDLRNVRQNARSKLNLSTLQKLGSLVRYLPKLAKKKTEAKLDEAAEYLFGILLKIVRSFFSRLRYTKRNCL